MSKSRISSDDLASAHDSRREDMQLSFDSQVNISFSYRSKKDSSKIPSSRSALSQSIDFSSVKGPLTTRSSIFAFGSSKPTQGIGKKKAEVLPELTPPPASPNVPYPAVAREKPLPLPSSNHQDAKILELEAQKSSLESQLLRLKETLCSSEANHISLEQGHQSLIIEHNRLKEELYSCKDELRMCKEKMENAQLTSDIFTRALSETVVQQDALFKGVQFPLEAAAAQLEAAEFKLQEQEEELESLRKIKVETVAKTQGMDELREENEWLQETIGKLQRQTASLETQLRQKAEEADSMTKVAEALKEAGAKLRLSEAESKRRGDAEIEKLRVAVAVAEENAQERAGEVRELQLALDAATHELNAAKENLEGLAQTHHQNQAALAQFEKDMSLQQDFLQSAISARQMAMQQVENEKLAKLEAESEAARHQEALKDAEEKIAKLQSDLDKLQTSTEKLSLSHPSPSDSPSLTPKASIPRDQETRGQYTSSLLSPYRLPPSFDAVAGFGSPAHGVSSTEALVSLLEAQLEHRESQLTHKESQMDVLRVQLEASRSEGEDKDKEIGLLMERVKVNTSLRAQVVELEEKIKDIQINREVTEIEEKENLEVTIPSALSPAPAAKKMKRFRPLRFLLGVTMKTLVLGSLLSVGVALSRTEKGKVAVDKIEEKVKEGARWSMDHAAKVGGAVANHAVKVGGAVAEASKASARRIKSTLSRKQKKTSVKV